jgi:hypothetical protein
VPLKFPKFTKFKALFTRKPKKESQVDIDIHTYTVPVDLIVKYKEFNSPAEKLKKLNTIKHAVEKCKAKAELDPKNSEELYRYDELLIEIERLLNAVSARIARK